MAEGGNRCRSSSARRGCLDAINPPGVLHLDEGEVKGQLVLAAICLELDSKDHLVFLHPRSPRFEIAVVVEFEARQESDELLPIDVGAIVLGSEQVSPINLT